MFNKSVTGYDISNFGAMVKSHRELCNYGVRYTAKEIGISPTTLSKIENGHLPDSETLKKVLDFFGYRLAFYYKPKD